MKLFFSQIFPILAIGLCAGFLNGLLGAGGGILIVFGLGILLRDRIADPRSVFASAIAVMLPLSVLSAIQYFRHGSLDTNALVWLILPAIAGGALGGLLLRRLSPAALSRLFAAVVLISGIVLVV
ncbi:MAG: TSUP family transporter [Clostridia bacterium]|nr:TSUP family transporter [Clostridia bacterium]